MDELTGLVGTENAQLVAALEGLDEDRQNAPSLCAGGRLRDVAVHLLMPYEPSVPGFLLRMVRHRLDFDAVADRLATDDPRSTGAVVDALRTLPDRTCSTGCRTRPPTWRGRSGRGPRSGPRRPR